MKNQALFSLKDKDKKLKCRLLQFLFGALRVKVFCDLRLPKAFVISDYQKPLLDWICSWLGKREWSTVFILYHPHPCL